MQFLDGAFFAFNVAVALKLSGAVTAFRWSFFCIHIFIPAVALVGMGTIGRRTVPRPSGPNTRYSPFPGRT